jgi:hypothetical protein
VALEPPIGDFVLLKNRLEVAGIVGDSRLAAPREGRKIIGDRGWRFEKDRPQIRFRSGVDGADRRIYRRQDGGVGLRGAYRRRRHEYEAVEHGQQWNGSRNQFH